MRSSSRYFTVTSTLLAIGLVAQRTWAEPQANVGLLPGMCLRTGDEAGPACLAFEVQGDVMLGRESASDVGWGPALAVGTYGGDDVRLRTSAGVQLPLEPLQFVVTPGPYLRAAETLEFGAGVRLFVGSRSYNHTGNYIAVFGLVAGVDIGLGDNRERSFVLAAHLDGMWLSLPLVALASWLRGHE